MPRPLTDRQAEVYQFIFEFTRQHGFQPAMREVGKAIGIQNINGVTGHLRLIAAKGWIEGAGEKSRAIRFLFTPAGKPFRGFGEAI